MQPLSFLHCPLSLSSAAVDKSQQHRNKFENAVNRTWDGWVGRGNATSELCRPTSHNSISQSTHHLREFEFDLMVIQTFTNSTKDFPVGTTQDVVASMTLASLIFR